MVFILDEGGVFEAPLEKIWKLNSSPTEHRHPSMKNMKVERTADPTTFFLTWETEVRGSTFKNKAKLIYLPPIGFAMDYVEGPLAGSKEFQYYIPKGNKTAITCVGEWKAAGFPDDQLRALVISSYDEAFREDQANLARMK